MKRSKNKPHAEVAEITGIVRISADTFRMTLRSPVIAGNAQPGQFVHVRINNTCQPFLRRPLSIGTCEGDSLMLIFVVRGKGTAMLAQMAVGCAVDLIGPLGSPFVLPGKEKIPILIAGGIGVVPLLLLDQKIPHEMPRHFILGVRSAVNMPVSERDIKKHSIMIASDDGSSGFHGNVVGLLVETLKMLEPSPVCIFGCGPLPMFKALQEFCKTHHIDGQVSLEASMGCGLGACQGCAVPKPGGAGYLLACCDGPVVNINDVDFNIEFSP